MDSGAFTQLKKYGDFKLCVDEYLDIVNKFNPLFYVSQDYLVERTDSPNTVQTKQENTVNRFISLWARKQNVIPVIHGSSVEQYRNHLKMYQFPQGEYIGVGSLVGQKISFKVNVFNMLKEERPDLLLHGFGFKQQELCNSTLRSMVYSADSMAWSFIARRKGQDPNDPKEAKNFEKQILSCGEKKGCSKTRTP